MLLLIAILNLPYNYYIFLRISIFIGNCYLLYKLSKLNIYRFEDLKQSLFGNVLMCMFIFNPIFQFHLEREQWFWLDIIFSIVYMFIFSYLICVAISDKKKDYFLIKVTNVYELIFIILIFISAVTYGFTFWY
jgi:uncharacterized membrane protein